MTVDYDTRYRYYVSRGMHPCVAAIQAHYDTIARQSACDTPKRTR